MIDIDAIFDSLVNGKAGPGVVIPASPFYNDMLQDLEELGYTITDEIVDLCEQIGKELDKQELKEA